jgi:hypothetical protein
MFNKNGSRGNTSACGSNGLVERERAGMGHKKRGEGREVREGCVGDVWVTRWAWMWAWVCEHDGRLCVAALGYSQQRQSPRRGTETSTTVCRPGKTR